MSDPSLEKGVPMVTLVLLALAALAAYAVACAVWPFAACRRCDGSGKRRSPSGRAWRSCGRCGGKGRRVRLGRRLWPSRKQV